MRIVVHDYAGHPFQVELSRELARRGHQVLHLHFGGLQTPKGDLVRRDGDPAGFEVEAVTLPTPFAKHSFVRRRFQERAYGHAVAARVAAFRPDIVFSGNMPTEPQGILQARCRKIGARFFFWVQDFYSVAVSRLLGRRWLGLGRLVGAWYQFLERRQLKASDAVIFITADFQDLARDWALDPARCHVIENWASLNAIRPAPQDNAWSRQHGLAGKTVFLYSGTLGMKHNPDLLWQLALAFRDRPEIRVVVGSEGLGADWLRARLAGSDPGNLLLLPFQPIDVYGEMLASAAVLTAVIEPEAGIFSVPSKVLSYLAAGRALLLAVPGANLAARTVLRAEAGLAVDPDDLSGYIAAARRLADESALCQRLGQNARRHAEANFDIGHVADRFEAILNADARNRAGIEARKQAA